MKMFLLKSIKLVACLVLTGLCACQSTQKKQITKPNVLMIVTDDQGYADFSAYGGADDVQTPHLDELASNGIHFTDAYVSMSVCSPSRMAMLTGRQQQRWGVYNYGANFPESEITLAEQLKANGYQTGMVGKTHYGPVSGPGHKGFPRSHGFD